MRRSGRKGEKKMNKEGLTFFILFLLLASALLPLGFSAAEKGLSNDGSVDYIFS
jgi:hypothetical protein